MAGRLLSRNQNPLFFEQEAPYIEIEGAFDTPLPEGVFPVVLCVTAAEIKALLSAASLGAIILEGSDAATLAPLYTALNTLDAPLCIDTGDACEDDIYADGVLALADGVLANVLEGGAFTALGYEIEEEGSIEGETELPLIAVAFVAVAAAFVVGLSLGGVAIGSVAVAAGETVELLISTGAASGTPIQFAAVAALAA